MTLKDQARKDARFGELFNMVPRGCQGFLVYKVRDQVRENNIWFVFNSKQAFAMPLTLVFIRTNKKILN